MVAKAAHIVDQLGGELRGSARLPGVDAFRLPGESARRWQARSRDGIPIIPASTAVLDKLAARLAVAPLATE